MSNGYRSGNRQRQNINEALYESYNLMNEAGEAGNISWGRDNQAWAWQIEDQAQDVVIELNKKIQNEEADDADIALRDSLVEKLETVSSSRNEARQKGDDPTDWSSDRPNLIDDDPEVVERAPVDRTRDESGAVEDLTEANFSNDEDAKKITERPDYTADIAEGEGKGSRIIRIAYQCFLLYNLHHFSRFHKTLLTQGSGERPSAYVPIATTGTDAGRVKTPGYWSRTQGLPRFHLVSPVPSSDSIMNLLQLRAGNEQFAYIPAHLYSHLVPSLRIFKIYRNRHGSSSDHAVEMKFDNKTSLRGITDKINAVHPDGNPSPAVFSRGTECGVKSFDWSFLGTDPYTATRDLKATLKLTFQHFTQISEEREGESASDPDGQPLKYKYIDLVVQPNCRDDSATPNYTRRYNPECYEIKVEVGYHDPGPNAGFTPELREALRCQKQDLRLIMVDHEFNINQDGTFDLTISYRGRLGSIMSDKKFNVLLPSGGFSDIKFDDPTSDGNPRNSYIKADIEEPLLVEQGQPENDRDNTKIKDLQFRRRRFYVRYRQLFHNGIVRSLADNGMIHTYELTDQEFDDFSKWEHDELRGTLPRPISATRAVGPPPAGDRQDLPPPVETEETNDPDEDPSAALTEEIDSEKFLNRLSNKVEKNGYTIDYFFLGDLLAVVTDHVLGERHLAGVMPTKRVAVGTRQVRRATGDVAGGMAVTADVTETVYEEQPDFDAPGSVSPVSDASLRSIINNFRLILGTINVRLGNETQNTILNLAHIPVSLEAFHQFMVTNVLGVDRLYYSYFEFLDDLLSEMVTDLLGSTCFGGLIDTGRLRSTTGLMQNDGPISDHMEGYSPDNRSADVGDDYRTLKPYKSTERSPAFGKCSVESNNRASSYDYLAIYASNTFEQNLAGDYNGDQNRGDPLGDRRRGIYHTAFGLDRGLLKEAQFKKTDQEYLPEARFASEGDNIFNQLANVYDATFSMLGTSMFKPGQHIYFNPVSMGAGQPWEYRELPNGAKQRSWANLMGLGGYHLITEVASSIKPGSYDTTLKARWVYSGQNEGST